MKNAPLSAFRAHKQKSVQLSTAVSNVFKTKYKSITKEKQSIEIQAGPGTENCH